MSKRLNNIVFLITYTDKIYFIMKFDELYNKNGTQELLYCKIFD